MSMGEYEGQLNSWEHDLPSLSVHSQGLPSDFSEEDMVFAQELDAVFSLHNEDIPPYFVQTLLATEESRFQPVEPGFEHKTRARVFRRLKLRRYLFHGEHASFFSVGRMLPGRRFLVTSAALILFMFLTVLYTAPSFASGMEIILRGAKSGVLLVKDYPSSLHPSHPRVNAIPRVPDALPALTLPEAIHQLHAWNLYWPKSIPDKYMLTDTYFYQEPEQSWADGPFMELDFSLPGKIAQGTGQLAIREFKLKPNVNVLQVVKDGAAQAIKVDAKGQAQAIYVDGQWIMRSKNVPVWIYGQRSELIYQKNGIVFWIVGDQRDGMNQNELFKIATSLEPFYVNRVVHMNNESSTGNVTMMSGDVNDPFTGDVLAIYLDGSGVDPYLSLVGTPSPSPTASPSPGVHSR